MSIRPERSDKTAHEMSLEQAAYFDDLKATTESVPTQKAFDTAEAFCLAQGRELIRQSLESIIQEQIDDHEKKETTLCPQCQQKKRHRGYRTKERLSALGCVKLERRYDECMRCKRPEHVADAPFGLASRYSLGLRRLAVFAAADKSYRKGSETLEEFCGFPLSYNTIRELCNEEAPKMEEWSRSQRTLKNSLSMLPAMSK